MSDLDRILAEHVPMEVDVLPFSCYLGDHKHPDEECSPVTERVCKACAPQDPDDEDNLWYEPEHLWPCVPRQAAERLQVTAFGFDVRFEAVERRGFPVVLDHATRTVAAFQTALGARAAAVHLNREPDEHVDWYRWTPDPEAVPRA